MSSSELLMVSFLNHRNHSVVLTLIPHGHLSRLRCFLLLGSKKIIFIMLLQELGRMDAEGLLQHRMMKFQKIGGIKEGDVVDPESKHNMKIHQCIPVLNQR